MLDLVLSDGHLVSFASRLFLFDSGDPELNLSVEGEEELTDQAILLDKEMAETLGKALLEWAQSR